MFENIANFFKKLMKSDKKQPKSKDSAKERLHLVLMQDRANVSADFLDLMKQEIIEVIKKYIDVDENAIDVRLTNKSNDDGTTGAPVLYANIPIMSVKDEAKEGARKVKAEAEVNATEENEEVSDKEVEETLELDKNENKEDDKTKEVIEKAEEIVEEINEEISEEANTESK